MDSPREIHIIEIPFFVVDKVRRSWCERLFSLPWSPWVKFNVFNTPSMVRIGNDIYCHPSLLTSAQRMLDQRRKKGDGRCECEWTWESAINNGMCEYCEKRQWFDEDYLET